MTQFTQEHAEQLARIDERTRSIQQSLDRMAKDYDFTMDQARWVKGFRDNLKWIATGIASGFGAIIMVVYNWWSQYHWGMIKK